ncbi:hypothetical protein LshimejAT787_1104340 [Lyophyllum shimeji]|uniref:Uncharacterized protein n=1 Tax=Lyophyllum shimeji TaxID=47721 RepID=A0A9P3PVS8_LYOSH|nr:hypothetical protein LshimejAT787_1104340 [Lyophyllum shimeji]
MTLRTPTRSSGGWTADGSLPKPINVATWDQLFYTWTDFLPALPAPGRFSHGSQVQKVLRICGKTRRFMRGHVLGYTSWICAAYSRPYFLDGGFGRFKFCTATLSRSAGSRIAQSLLDLRSLFVIITPIRVPYF